MIPLLSAFFFCYLVKSGYSFILSSEIHIDSSNVLGEFSLVTILLISGLLFSVLSFFLAVELGIRIERSVDSLQRRSVDSLEIWKDKIILNEYSCSNSLIRVICNMMDEEGRAYLSEIKLEWKQLGLTQGQINRKGLDFAMSHYCGRFIEWLRLPRFLSPIKTKY
jgi:hypothetical protein